MLATRATHSLDALGSNYCAASSEKSLVSLRDGGFHGTRQTVGSNMPPCCRKSRESRTDGRNGQGVRRKPWKALKALSLHDDVVGSVRDSLFRSDVSDRVLLPDIAVHLEFAAIRLKVQVLTRATTQGDRAPSRTPAFNLT